VQDVERQPFIEAHIDRGRRPQHHQCISIGRGTRRCSRTCAADRAASTLKRRTPCRSRSLTSTTPRMAPHRYHGQGIGSRSQSPKGLQERCRHLTIGERVLPIVLGEWRRQRDRALGRWRARLSVPSAVGHYAMSLRLSEHQDGNPVAPSSRGVMVDSSIPTTPCNVAACDCISHCATLAPVSQYATPPPGKIRTSMC
jgi:hypothetical protein